MNYALLHVFPAILNVYSFLRDAVQLSALQVKNRAYLSLALRNL